MNINDIIKEQAAQAGHYYTKEGKPAYTIIGKNGKERNTTVRDAKRLGLVPSVTQVIKESNKPGLLSWKEEQAIMAALTMPLIEGETDKEYIARIKADSRVQASKAAARGIQIHTWIQQGFEGKPLPPDEAPVFFATAQLEILEHCDMPEWICEQSFSNGQYGGKVDLHSPDYLIDIKTKESIVDVKTYDEHVMQIAAYQHGIGHKGKGGMLFVSTKPPLEAKLIWIKSEKLERGLNMFHALVDYYYAKTGL